MYTGYDEVAAKTIFKLCYQLQPPMYKLTDLAQNVSRFILKSDRRIVELFKLSLESDLDQTVHKARIYSRTTRMKLKHLERYASLHGIEVRRISDCSIKLVSATRWTLTLVNDGKECLWRADLSALGLRWRGLDRLKGWSGKDSRYWMMELYNRMLGHQIKEYAEPSERVQRSPIFRKWVKNIPIPASQLRPSMQRAQGWNPAIPYKNWVLAMKLGAPSIHWL